MQHRYFARTVLALVMLLGIVVTTQGAELTKDFFVRLPEVKREIPEPLSAGCTRAGFQAPRHQGMAMDSRADAGRSSLPCPVQDELLHELSNTAFSVAAALGELAQRVVEAVAAGVEEGLRSRRPIVPGARHHLLLQHESRALFATPVGLRQRQGFRGPVAPLRLDAGAGRPVVRPCLRRHQQGNQRLRPVAPGQSSLRSRLAKKTQRRS